MVKSTQTVFPHWEDRVEKTVKGLNINLAPAINPSIHPSQSLLLLFLLLFSQGHSLTEGQRFRTEGPARSLWALTPIPGKNQLNLHLFYVSKLTKNIFESWVGECRIITKRCYHRKYNLARIKLCVTLVLWWIYLCIVLKTLFYLTLTLFTLVNVRIVDV